VEGSAGVEPALDVLEDGGPCLGAGRPVVAVDELLLQRGVEALADGVIEAVTLGPGREGDPGLLAAAGEEDRGVLAALVGMVDHPRGRVCATRSPSAVRQ
jgi:hypothetical protein